MLYLYRPIPFLKDQGLCFVLFPVPSCFFTQPGRPLQPITWVFYLWTLPITQRKAPVPSKRTWVDDLFEILLDGFGSVDLGIVSHFKVYLKKCFSFLVFSLTLGCWHSSIFQQDILLKTINPSSRTNRSDDFFCDYVCLVFDWMHRLEAETYQYLDLAVQSKTC